MYQRDPNIDNDNLLGKNPYKEKAYPAVDLFREKEMEEAKTRQEAKTEMTTEKKEGGAGEKKGLQTPKQSPKNIPASQPKQDYLVLVDANSLFMTVYYASLPKPLKEAKGEDRNSLYRLIPKNKKGNYLPAVKVFLQVIRNLMQKQNPKYIAFAWDSPKLKRKLWFSEYKEGRKKKEPPCIQQIETTKRVLKALGFMQYECEGFEADDILSSLAKIAKELKVPTKIYTKDQDLLACVDENTEVWLSKGEKDLERMIEQYGKQEGVPKNSFAYTPEIVKKEKGVEPHQIAYLKALAGDSGDNIKGVAGIGPEKARKIIELYPVFQHLIMRIYDDDVNGFVVQTEFANNGLKAAYADLTKTLENNGGKGANFSAYHEAMISFKLAMLLNAPVKLNLSKVEIAEGALEKVNKTLDLMTSQIKEFEEQNN